MNERPALGTAVLYVLAALAVVMSVYPFLYALSTSFKSASSCSRYQRRKRCASITQLAGTNAPARKRSRVIGSKSIPPVMIGR